jgi:peptidylprolyl isomerase
VVQWGDPDGKRDQGEAVPKLAAEFSRSSTDAPSFTLLVDGDVYAPEVGFVAGFPAARDPARKELWLAHCYGMVGVGRDEAIDSGNGSELYVVNGHAPRHLDRNVTLVGRVLQGMEALSSMPRGGGAMGFYAEGESRPIIRQVRLGADMPEAERVDLQILRTDGDAFDAVIKARRHRRESWFHTPTGKVELCNVPLPVRVVD